MGVEDIANVVPDTLGVSTAILMSVAGIEGNCEGVIVDWGMVFMGVATSRLTDELEGVAWRIDVWKPEIMVLIVAKVTFARLRSCPRPR